MRLLSRYILRQLTLPFLFGLAALTGVMLLNVVSRRFPQLVGKGLPASVIGEVFLLSLPFIIAMSLPLAVLASVLYAFSHLASDSEITAIRAGGVSTWGMLRAVLAWACVMGLATFCFVDQVLPRANSRLRNLYFDIARKKPTFELTEQVINTIPPSQYFLRASRIERNTGRLRSVSIYDIGQPERRRIIYADSGVMGLAPGGSDLTLRLYHGTVQQLNATEADQLQHTSFREQEIVIRDVFDSLQRSTDQLDRGDREMSTCELLSVVDSARNERQAAADQRRVMATNDLRLLLRLPLEPVPDEPEPAGPYRGAYCGVFADVGTLLGGRTAGDSTNAQEEVGKDGEDGKDGKVGEDGRVGQVGQTEGGQGRRDGHAGRNGAGQVGQAPVPPAPSDSAKMLALGQGSVTPVSPAPPGPPALTTRLTNLADLASSPVRERLARRRAARFEVEVHKKWALSFASITFVLLAVALALRFPRGGMGLVLGGGMFVYAVFYVGLTAGESLADRGFVSPLVAMWLPNAILMVLALFGLWRVTRESGSTRGGDLSELAEMLKGLVRRRRRPVAASGSA